MFPVSEEIFSKAVENQMIMDLGSATIRQICSLADEIEEKAGEKMIHLEMGSPGLDAESVGIEAEVKALKGGIANKYPNIAGIPQLKKAGKKFIKAFANIDVEERCIIPTVGSMQGSFTLQLLLSKLSKEKDTMLFLTPGFPAQITQAKVLGINIEEFDIYHFRGAALEAKLESYLSKGNIAGLVYSNPNNPAWTNFTEQELEIIGRLATRYDCIVLEDLAYFGMDFRRDISTPFQPPYASTVANYTDNYILMLSASKIFSYAGQRIAIVCISPKLFVRKYESLEKFFEMPKFGDAYIFGVLYCASSGTSHSGQYAMAEMLDAAAEGNLKFIAHCSEYGRRAAIVKKMFTDNGFHIVYDMDGNEPIADGFFFTIGYKDMTGKELQKELIRYGVSAIPLDSTGSEQEGIRACVSTICDDEGFARLERFLKKFNEDHSKN